MRICIYAVFLILVNIITAQSITIEQSYNTSLIGRLANGPCRAVDVSGNIAYFGNGGYLEIVDISHPDNPIL